MSTAQAALSFGECAPRISACSVDPIFVKHDGWRGHLENDTAVAARKYYPRRAAPQIVEILFCVTSPSAGVAQAAPVPPPPPAIHTSATDDFSRSSFSRPTASCHPLRPGKSRCPPHGPPRADLSRRHSLRPTILWKGCHHRLCGDDDRGHRRSHYGRPGPHGRRRPPVQCLLRRRAPRLRLPSPR